MIIELFSFASATVLFLILGLVMLTGQRDNLQKRMLALASIVSAVWAASVTYQAAFGGLLSLSLSLELLRALAWFSFLLVMLRTAYKTSGEVSRHFRIAFGGLSAFILGLMLLALYRIAGGSVFEFIAGNDILVGHLLVSIGGIVMIEQLYRNTSEEHKWALKYLWIAIGGMFAYDFYLYSDALLFQRIDAQLWNARGFIHAMVVPLIGVAIKREMQWSLRQDSIDIFVSRRIAFHTTTLLAAGLYMIIIGFGGYFVREYGGSWGAVAQATFLFGSALVLAVLLFSGKIRARVKVLLNKHFFHYKYDYREEWLRIIRTLTTTEGSGRLQERAIRALAQIIDSPGGQLWMRNESGYYEHDEHWNMQSAEAREPQNSSFIRFLEDHQFVIRLDEYETNRDLYTRLAPLELPEWLTRMPDAWLVVPLMLQDSLLGFVVLRYAPSHGGGYFNWEDSDLLKTAARQTASYLAQHEAAQALISARRFEEVNKFTAFIVHDLKNLIGQLSMVVSNAARHKNNPLFMEDAISTVENSVNKMNKMLNRLRGGVTTENVKQINLCDLLEEVIRSCSKSGALPVPVLHCQLETAFISADKDRMIANLGHILQNAQEATDDEGKITVRLMKKHDGCATIEVEDNGSGMDKAFIQEKLFQPFESTKGTMGIGVFQVREYINKLGGELQVESSPGEGTIFRLHVPIAQQKGPAMQHPHIIHINDKRR